MAGDYQLGNPRAYQPVTVATTSVISLRNLNVLKRYDGHRRSGLGVVELHGRVCRGCHLTVAQGDINRMKRGQLDWLCPNCGRYLVVE